MADSSWLYVVPWGIRKLLNYIHTRYSAPWIMITENGVDVPNESAMPLAQALNDTFRVNYYSSYLDNIAKAMNEDSVSVMGYFAWSLLVSIVLRNLYGKLVLTRDFRTTSSGLTAMLVALAFTTSITRTAWLVILSSPLNGSRTTLLRTPLINHVSRSILN